MPTNRKRTVRHRNLSAVKIPENDLEYLCNGSVGFTGETHSFKTLKDARKFYFRNKKWIFHLQGVQIPGVNKGCYYFNFGARPWCWWQFEIQDAGLCFKFALDPAAGFEYLKDNKLLLDGEAEKYRQHVEALQKEDADMMALAEGTRVIVDNTKSVD